MYQTDSRKSLLNWLLILGIVGALSVFLPWLNIGGLISSKKTSFVSGIQFQAGIVTFLLFAGQIVVSVLKNVKYNYLYILPPTFVPIVIFVEAYSYAHKIGSIFGSSIGSGFAESIFSNLSYGVYITFAVSFTSIILAFQLIMILRREAELEGGYQGGVIPGFGSAPGGGYLMGNYQNYTPTNYSGGYPPPPADYGHTGSQEPGKLSQPNYGGNYTVPPTSQGLSGFYDSEKFRQSNTGAGGGTPSATGTGPSDQPQSSGATFFPGAGGSTPSATGAGASDQPQSSGVTSGYSTVNITEQKAAEGVTTQAQSADYKKYLEARQKSKSKMLLLGGIMMLIVVLSIIVIVLATKKPNAENNTDTGVMQEQQNPEE
jgi:hypothetical protein